MYVERQIPSAYILHRRKAVSDVCEGGLIEEFYPKTSLKNSRIMEFDVEGNSTHLIVPSAIFLKLKLGLVCTRTAKKPGPDGKLVDKAPDFSTVSVVNNLFGSLFNMIEVRVQNVATKSNWELSHYISYQIGRAHV